MDNRKLNKKGWAALLLASAGILTAGGVFLNIDVPGQGDVTTLITALVAGLGALIAIFKPTKPEQE